MSEPDTWELLRQEVGRITPELCHRDSGQQISHVSEAAVSVAATVPQALRSRSRARRRRRKRAWAASWASLLAAFAVYLLNTQIGVMNQLLRLVGVVGPTWLQIPPRQKTLEAALDEAIEAASRLIQDRA
jgi:hypothetical protein